MPHHPIVLRAPVARTLGRRLASPVLTILALAALSAPGSALAQDAYTGPVTELALRGVTAPLATFEAARDAFVAALTEQPGVGTDREFVALLDGTTFEAPEEIGRAHV